MASSTIKADVLVIGGGPAGITFSRYLKKLKPQAEVIVFRPEEHSMIYCAIPYAIEGLFSPEKTFKSDALVTSSGAKLIKREVKEVDLKNKRVVDASGDTYIADTIFIATGADPFVPPIDGSDAENIYTVKTQVDMERIISTVEKGAKRAVVVGAGAIGIEQAQAYAERGVEVYLIDIASRILPAMVDEDMAESINKTIQSKGIKLLLSLRAERIEKEGRQAKRLYLSNGESIDLSEGDFICFSVGVKPNLKLFQGQGLETGRDGIIVDSRMRTNISGVYAAGDCCQYHSALDKKPVGGKLATNAVPMAKTAARVIAGWDDEYPGFYNGAATCVYDLRVASCGFTAEFAQKRGIDVVCGYGQTTTLFPMMPQAKDLRVKIVADKSNLRVIGGQIISYLPAADKIDVITLALQCGLTLKGLAKLSYSAQPWQSFMPARSAIVQACENAIDIYAKESKDFRYSELAYKI